MYTPEELFIRNIDKLKEFLANPTEENLFESSRMLRQLLADEQPLLHQANRNKRQKISFTIYDSGLQHPSAKERTGFAKDITFWAPLDGFSPRLGRPGRPTVTLNLDYFLKQPVAVIEDQMPTVLDVIKYLANYAGAIHKGTPDTPQTITLEAVAKELKFANTPSVIRMLLGVVDVVVEACEPLYQALKANEPG